MAYGVILPKIDEAMIEGRIAKWIVQEGEKVEKGTVLFIVETEKVTWEVESPAAGVVSRHLFNAGDMVPVGVIVIYILAEDEEMPQECHMRPGPGETKQDPNIQKIVDTIVITQDAETSGDKIKATPLAKKIASELSVDLSMVAGTGPGGRIKREDVEGFVQSRCQSQTPIAEAKSDDIVPLSSMQKTIARRMTESFQSAPHFFLTVEVDMAELKHVRETLLPVIEKKTGIRITFTDLFVKIVARAVEDHPAVNVSWAGDALSVHQDIDIGIAVDVEKGLLVPVLKKANTKNIEEIAKNRMDVVDRARRGKLMSSEMKGGSLTISNLGMYGIDQFSPIINPPESCILGIGRMVEKQVIRNGSATVRPMAHLTLSADHRVLDGGSGSRFLLRISELIENPLLLM